MLLKFFIVVIFMQASYSIGPFLLPLGVENKPFVGEFELNSSKKPSGIEVTHATNRIKVYRASDGSVRFENVEKESEKILTVSIYNQSEKKIYFLEVESKSVYVMPVSDSASESNSESPNYLGQDIGKKNIENFICRGYRKERGENDVFEYWISEELNQLLLAKSIIGNEATTLRLFNIKRIEPNRKIFVIPQDYKLIKIE